MIDYSSHLQQLLSSQVDGVKDSTYYLSVYQPNTGLSKNQVKPRIKSLVLGAIHDHQIMNQGVTNESFLLDSLYKKIDSLDELKRGLAVFAKFDLENGQIELKKPVVAVPLIKKPIKKVRLAHTFDLDQLISTVFADIDAIVVRLHRKSFQVYQFQDLQLKKIKHQENKFIGEKPDEYLEKYAPTGKRDGIYHSTGSDKYGRRIKKQNELFMHKLEDYLLDELELKFKFLVTFYSDYYDELIDSYRQKMTDRLGAHRVVLIDKILDSDEKVKGQMIGVWKDLTKKRKEKYARDLEEKYYGAKKGWNDVTKAARRGQVYQLFIKSDLIKPGYVSTQDQNLVYSYPAKNTMKVDNIAPWLVKSVKNQSGKVRVMDGEEYQDYPDVMAQLRYRLEE